MIDIKSAVELAARTLGHTPNPTIVAAIVNHADEFEAQSFDTPLLQIQAIAQFAVESAGFTTVWENLNYSTAAMRKAWPTRFRTDASTLPYVHNPEKLANFVYGGRMNNTRPGSGYLNRGQGILQTTGQDNIDSLAEEMGVSADEARRMLTDPEHMLKCALANFRLRGAIPYAAKNNTRAVSLKVNGGENGMTERLHVAAVLYSRFVAPTIGKTAASTAKPIKAGAAPLYVAPLGIMAPEVPEIPAEKAKAIQQKLIDIGYGSQVGLANGDFGPNTESAIFAFQRENGLPPNGQLDDDTEAAIWSAGPRILPASRTEATADDLRAKGSETIAAADDASTGSKVVAGDAGVAAASQVLDAAQKATSTASQIKDTSDTATGLLPWFMSNWLLIVGTLAAGVCLYVLWTKVFPAIRAVIAARVKDHQTLANTGR
jgi:putative chitinase